MTVSDITLSLWNLGYTIDTVSLFSGISLQLSSGHGLILRGRNGSGKTTLLRIAAGLTSPTAGNTTLHRAGMEDDIQPNCHYLGHKNGLKDIHTVRQNLAFFHTFDAEPGLTPDEAARRLEATHLLPLPVHVLSAGQKRRIAVARLLVSNRPLWILDEPTAALDAASSDIVEHIVHEHLTAGGIALIATHRPFLKNRAGDRLHLIDLSAPAASEARI